MKLDDHIKETLEKRTIKPSDTSWSTLADRLDAADKIKNKVVYWWLGIAASVVVILFTVTVFITGNRSETEIPILVDTQKQVDSQFIPMEKLPTQRQVVEVDKNKETFESLQKNSPQNEFINKQIDLKISEKQIIAAAKIDKENVVEPLQTDLLKDILENEKVTEIVAQIQDLKNEGHVVSDADIEILLAQAQKEIRFQTIINDGTFTVDASALLQDVESDLEQSFRNKIFEAFKQSFEIVKTAVAERNN